MADHADKLFVAEIFDPTKWYGALFYALAFLLGATILARLVRKATVGFGLHQKHALIDPTIVSFFGDLGQASIYILSALFYFHLIPLLHNVGTALLTGVSVVSIVLMLCPPNLMVASQHRDENALSAA